MIVLWLGLNLFNFLVCVVISSSDQGLLVRDTIFSLLFAYYLLQRHNLSMREDAGQGQLRVVLKLPLQILWNLSQSSFINVITRFVSITL